MDGQLAVVQNIHKVIRTQRCIQYIVYLEMTTVQLHLLHQIIHHKLQNMHFYNLSVPGKNRYNVKTFETMTRILEWQSCTPSVLKQLVL